MLWIKCPRMDEPYAEDVCVFKPISGPFARSFSSVEFRISNLAGPIMRMRKTF